MPPREDLEPSPVDPERIELIYHGLGSWIRGLRELVDAMREIDRRFVLTSCSPAWSRPWMSCRRTSPTSPTASGSSRPHPCASWLAPSNDYDVAVMFFPPRTQNLVYTLPNKLFEAVQGRLAIVTGPTKLMVQAVEEFGNGVVTAGWEPSDLAAAINGLTPERIGELKRASHAAAATANAEAERAVFLRSVGQSSD
jgi:hypothetical protein